MSGGNLTPAQERFVVAALRELRDAERAPVTAPLAPRPAPPQAPRRPNRAERRAAMRKAR